MNELSFMFLQAVKNWRFAEQRQREGLAEDATEFLLKAWDVHRFTAGIAFFNDDVIIRDMLADGYALEDAREYSIVGCVEPRRPAKTFLHGGQLPSIVRALRCTNEGRLFYNEGATIGARTPPASTFESFDDVKRAFAEQVRFCVETAHLAMELKDQAYRDFYPSPLLSSTIIGCLESGRDATRGGARYNNGHLETQGLATVVDSLAAIRWAVFEEKLLSMEELAGHLLHRLRGQSLYA
jgi:formate C-acetyltransferase